MNDRQYIAHMTKGTWVYIWILRISLAKKLRIEEISRKMISKMACIKLERVKISAIVNKERGHDEIKNHTAY